jgi:Tol biopolymer transport system component
MNADGSNAKQLTFSAPAQQNKGSPDWSPDGQHIVYFSQPNGTGSSREIFEMNADGSNQLQLTFNALLDARPSYSPDGKRILFYRQTGGSGTTNEIFVMNRDGSGQTQLTFNAIDDRAPDFSLDGQLLIATNILLPSRRGAGDRPLQLRRQRAAQPDQQHPRRLLAPMGSGRRLRQEDGENPRIQCDGIADR